VGGAVALLSWFSYGVIRPFYDQVGWIPAAAAAARELDAPNEPVLTVVCDSNPTLLYHTHRPGWVFSNEDSKWIALALEQGARVLILQAPSDCDAPASPPWLGNLRRMVAAEHYSIWIQSPLGR
jgi:hypothetical protein